MILSIVMTSTVSCEKFLDEKPDKKLTTPSTVADLQALLDNLTTMNLRVQTFDEASSDDYFLNTSNFNAVSEKGRNSYLWLPFYTTNDNGWKYPSNTIYLANVCLENSQQIVRTSANSKDLDNVIGSAYFFRAYTLLKLAWTYSKSYDAQTSSTDLGIVLRKGTDFNTLSTRSSVEESYQQIISDLEAAIPLLPVFSANLFRPSKGAAHAVLARAYLSMRKYESALHHSNESLKINDLLLDYNNINQNATWPFQMLNKEVIFHSETSTYSYINFPNFALIDTNLIDTYNKYDLRKDAFYKKTGNYYLFKGSYSGGSPLFNGITTAEVILMKSECLARTGQIQSAQELLNNLIRTRWDKNQSYTNFSGTNQEIVLNWILQERRKELVMRGLRWMDIKRLNKEGFNIRVTRFVNGNEYVLLPNDDKYALPIPNDIIELTGMQQNPGWL